MQRCHQSPVVDCRDGNGRECGISVGECGSRPSHDITVVSRAAVFQMEVERVLAGIPGIGGVKCTFDHGGNWQPGNMTVSAQRKLADRREFVRSRAVKSAKTA